MKRTLVFTGSYTQDILLGTGETVSAQGEGISTFLLEEGGKLSKLFSLDAPNPSYLALCPTGQYLYCVNELKEYKGLPGSAVSAYRLEPDGSPCFINRRPTGGEDACHLGLSPKGRHLLCSNFTGGSLCVFPLEGEKGIGRASCFFQHYGRGANPLRQASPHVHQLLSDPSGGRVLACDLGTDELALYKADWAKGYLSPTGASISVPAGLGPRQCVWNAAGDRLYVLTEMGNALCVYAYTAQTGEAALLQTISTLPPGEGAESIAACVKLHPKGGLLFASNRGHDSIAAYRIGADGLLTLLAITKTAGGSPRDFDLTPDGSFLIVGNQEGNSLVCFQVDAQSGGLTEVCRAPCGSVTAVKAVCL